MRNPLNRLRAGAVSLRIGLAPDGIALVRDDGRRPSRLEVAADCLLPPGQTATPQAVAEQLRRVLTEAGCGNQDAAIVLHDQWARFFMVTPPRNTGSLRDCQAAAAMRFQELYGEPASGWQIDADWDARSAFLACALPHALLASLQQVSKEFTLTLLSVAPQFIRAWNQWHRQLDGDSWFGLAHGNRLSLAPIAHARLQAVCSVAVPAGAWQDPQWLPLQLTRESLRLNLAAPSRLQLCGLACGPDLLAPAAAAICSLLDAPPATPAGALSAAVMLARTGVRG